MAEDDGDEMGPTSQQIAQNRASKTVLTVITGIVAILAVLNIASTHLLPYEASAVVSTILFDAMVVVFIGVQPILAVILWRVSKQFSQRGYWGFLLLVIGLGATMSGMDVEVSYEVIDTFLPQPLHSSVFATASILVILGGSFCTLLGMVILIVIAVRVLLLQFQDWRQVRLGD